MTDQQTTAVTIVPATIAGYAVLHFPKQPAGKVNLDRVNEIVQQNLHSVLAWKLLQDGTLEPLTIAPPADASSVRYLRHPAAKFST